MKCINENCNSTDIEMIAEGQNNVVKRAFYGIGVAACFVAGAVPQLKGGAIHVGRKLDEKFHEDASRKFRCKKCGCVWTKTRWI